MEKVIAIGNRFLMDDGIGIVVVERLAPWLREKKIDVIICETDFFSCFNQLRNDDFIIIIDAAYTKGIPGTIHISSIKKAIEAYGVTGSQHELSIFDFIKQYSINLRGYLISIEVAEVSFSYELSNQLKNKLNEICEEVRKGINNLEIDLIEQKDNEILF